MSRIHVLKAWPQYFAGVANKNKPFELRLDDRKYQVGEILLLREWRPELHAYTGQTQTRVITYKLSLKEFEGLATHLQNAPDFCILGLREALCDEEDIAEQYLRDNPFEIHGESSRRELPRNYLRGPAIDRCPSSLHGE